MMFCAKICDAVRFIGTHTFVDDKMNVLVNQYVGEIFLKITEYKDVFYDSEKGHAPDKILLKIKKTDSTCQKNQMQFSSVFLSNLTEAALKILGNLAEDWWECTHIEDFYRFLAAKDQTVLIKTGVDEATYKLLDQLRLDKGFTDKFGLCLLRKTIYMIGFWENLKEFSLALRAESLALVNSPPPLSLLAARTICYEGLYFKQLSEDLVEKVNEESKFCFKKKQNLL